MTYQRPAYEQVTIAHGGNTVTLRPSLRAAVTLEARFGFPAMFRALEEGSFTIISEIILAASISRRDAATFLGEGLGRSLSSFFGAVCQPLEELISMFTPAPSQTAKPTSEKAKPIALPDLYRMLYRTATGELGWTPETAWMATPTEINEAYIGKFGIGEKQPDPDQPARNVAAGLDPEFDRNALRALKAKIASGS
jgi:hypothetical protein